jgi:formylglycine-generating enzyme required for sulfatase activity
VTKKEYAEFIKATGHENGSTCVTWSRPAEGTTEANISFSRGVWSDTTHGTTEYHPVLCVSAEDAQSYAKWLSKETGKNYRLPTESEWEYASRAGSKTSYFSGNQSENLCQYGNVFDQRGHAALEKFYGIKAKYANCDDQADFTTVVGMYQPNAFGLHDTIGNVNEIVADCEHNSYQGAPNDGSAWTTDCELFYESKMWIHRGGAYGAWSGPKSQRSASRGHMGPGLRSSLGEGFRLVRELPVQPNLQTPKSTLSFIKGLTITQQKEVERRAKLVSLQDSEASNIVKSD